MLSLVEPERLTCTLMMLAAVKSTPDETAGADAGISWRTALTLSLKIAQPVTNRVPALPIDRQCTVTCDSHDKFVCEAVSASAADEARIVPLASAPVP